MTAPTKEIQSQRGPSLDDVLAGAPGADADPARVGRARANVSLKQILAFLSVANTENFTTSAEALCTTQSAVSNLIKELERELDLRLFERTTRTVRLTDAGREFYGSAHRVYAEFQAAMAKAKSLAERKRGKVTIAASPLMASLVLPEALAEFRALYPEINVVLRDAAFDQVRRLVLDGEAEFGFGLAPDPDSGLVGEVLMSGPLNLIFPAGHPLEEIADLTWHDIAKHPFIALTSDNGTRQTAEQCAREVGVILSPAYEVSFIWTAISMVDAGLGVCVVPCYVRSLGSKKNIKLRNIHASKSDASIALIRRSEVVLSEGASQFQQFIRDYIR